MKFPEADYKQFLIRLKKLASESSHIKRMKNNKARFQLDQSFKMKANRKLEKGEPIAKALKTSATTKPKKAAQKKIK